MKIKRVAQDAERKKRRHQASMRAALPGGPHAELSDAGPSLASPPNHEGPMDTEDEYTTADSEDSEREPTVDELEDQIRQLEELKQRRMTQQPSNMRSPPRMQVQSPPQIQAQSPPQVHMQSPPHVQSPPHMQQQMQSPPQMHSQPQAQLTYASAAAQGSTTMTVGQSNMSDQKIYFANNPNSNQHMEQIETAHYDDMSTSELSAESVKLLREIDEGIAAVDFVQDEVDIQTTSETYADGSLNREQAEFNEVVSRAARKHASDPKQRRGKKKH